MALSKTTQDHEEIRKWAEARGAVPAEVGGTGGKRTEGKNTEGENSAGILRLEFPNAATKHDSNLREISWDEFFSRFDESDLEMVYQETTADGKQSNFNKLIHPESQDHSRHSSGRKSKGGRKEKAA